MLLKKVTEKPRAGYLAAYLRLIGCPRMRLLCQATARGGASRNPRGEFERLARMRDDPERHFTRPGRHADQRSGERQGEFSQGAWSSVSGGGYRAFYLGQLSEAEDKFDDAMKWYQQVNDGASGSGAIAVAIMLSHLNRIKEARDWLAGVAVQDDASGSGDPRPRR